MFDRTEIRISSRACRLLFFFISRIAYPCEKPCLDNVESKTQTTQTHTSLPLSTAWFGHAQLACAERLGSRDAVHLYPLTIIKGSGVQLVKRSIALYENVAGLGPRAIGASAQSFHYKTCLFKLKMLQPKKENFQIKIWYFSNFCSKHRLWVLVRTALPRRF